MTTYGHVPTQILNVGGTRFAYRKLGVETGVPVIFLHHFGANLDDWDPRVIDAIAAQRPVVAFDNRGMGASEGRVPTTVEAMAADAIAVIRALGYKRVDLFGFSLGGFVAQTIARYEPRLVGRIVLAGTGPAGGEGIDQVLAASMPKLLRGELTFKDPRHYLFFSGSPVGKAAARSYLARLKERRHDRDKRVSLRARAAQVKAIHAWGRQQPWDLTAIRQPVLVANGDDDVMVPTGNSHELARRLPDARLRIYPDAGHGGVFQYHEQFVEEVLSFLDASASSALRNGGRAREKAAG
jgi:pimeloyl-ACP methyl ester carboxylesterase